MSRFFAATVEDSDDSSDEELLTSSEEEEVSETESAAEESEDGEDEGSDSEDDSEESEDSEFASDDSDSESDSDRAAMGASYFLKKTPESTANRFLLGAESDDSDSDDEERKVVKSAKDKLIDEIVACSTAIDKAKKINDWTVVLSEFEKLMKLTVRATQQNMPTPNAVIRVLAGLQDFVAEDAASGKKLNAINAKSRNTVKQRVRKVARDYTEQLEAYRADPGRFASNEEYKVEIQKAAKPVQRLAAEDDDGFTTVAAGGKAAKATKPAESVLHIVAGIVESRGRKNVDRQEQVRTLTEILATDTTTVYERIRVYLVLVPLRLDAAAHLVAGSATAAAAWQEIVGLVNDLLALLEEHRSEFVVRELAAVVEDLEAVPAPNAAGEVEIPGSVASLVERLDDEFGRALLAADPHTQEYIDRLKEEPLLYATLVRAQLYNESCVAPEEDAEPAGEPLARLIARRVDHVYYKPSSLVWEAERAAAATLGPRKSRLAPDVAEFDAEAAATFASKLIDSLASFLYRQPNPVYRGKVMANHIYHYALNNEYFKARDMFLMSHLQSSIRHSDPLLQIQFNRALAQLGLAAFRAGEIADAQQALQELYASPRQRELLGQGTGRFGAAPGPAEAGRLLPFHMHINLELLECVFLTASLLLEVPQLARAGALADPKRRAMAKSFRRALEFHARLVFAGPPENTRDVIMEAARSLFAGDWKPAREMLVGLKIWKLLPQWREVTEMLAGKLQVEGLRCYLFTYKGYYQTLSLETLATVFELSVKKVTAVVAKMIFQEELKAFLDQTARSIIFTDRVEYSRFQQVALQLAEKATQLSDRNERLVAGGHQNSGPEHRGDRRFGRDGRDNRDNRDNRDGHREHRDRDGRNRTARVAA